MGFLKKLFPRRDDSTLYEIRIPLFLERRINDRVDKVRYSNGNSSLRDKAMIYFYRCLRPVLTDGYRDYMKSLF